MEIIPAVDPRKAPVQTRLVLVVPGTVLRQYALSIRSDNRMEIRPEARLGDLGENRLLGALASAVLRDRFETRFETVDQGKLDSWGQWKYCKKNVKI